MVFSRLKYREVSPHIGPRTPLTTMVSRQTQVPTGWSGGQLGSNLPSVRHAISAVLSVYDLDTHRSLNQYFSGSFLLKELLEIQHLLFLYPITFNLYQITIF